MWYFMLHSGVHATITGVLLAFVVPFGNGGEKSPSYILQHFLHKPVAFFILPVFAIANTCIPLSGNIMESLSQTYSYGIIAGLVIGKPLGIFLFSFVAAALGICTLPPGLTWKQIVGAGFLGGIGFTMSIFITLLAFEDTDIVNNSKIAILVASVDCRDNRLFMAYESTKRFLELFQLINTTTGHFMDFKLCRLCLNSSCHLMLLDLFFIIFQMAKPGILNFRNYIYLVQLFIEVF